MTPTSRPKPGRKSATTTSTPTGRSRTSAPSTASSSGTLRDRMRRWRWARRRPPIPLEGPPAPAPRPAARRRGLPPIETDIRAWTLAVARLCRRRRRPAAPTAPDNRPITERLQGAVDRMLPAIEAHARHARRAGPRLRARLERAARALAALTRTLRELNGLLAQRQAAEPREDIEAVRARLARKIGGALASRAGSGGRSLLVEPRPIEFCLPVVAAGGAARTLPQGSRATLASGTFWLAALQARSWASPFSICSGRLSRCAHREVQRLGHATLLMSVAIAIAARALHIERRAECVMRRLCLSRRRPPR